MSEIRRCLRCGSAVEVTAFGHWLTFVGLKADYRFVCCGCGLRHHITNKFSEDSAIIDWNEKEIK